MNYWVLQANSHVYPGVPDYSSDIPEKVDYWCIRNHSGHVKKHDRFFIWHSGSERGIYNVGKIISIEPHEPEAQRMLDLMWITDVRNHKYEPKALERLRRYPKILVENEYEEDFQQYFSENELRGQGFNIRVSQGGIFYQHPDTGQQLWQFIHQSGRAI